MSKLSIIAVKNGIQVSVNTKDWRALELLAQENWVITIRKDNSNVNSSCGSIQRDMDHAGLVNNDNESALANLS